MSELLPPYDVDFFTSLDETVLGIEYRVVLNDGTNEYFRDYATKRCDQARARRDDESPYEALAVKFTDARSKTVWVNPGLMLSSNEVCMLGADYLNEYYNDLYTYASPRNGAMGKIRNLFPGGNMAYKNMLKDAQVFGAHFIALETVFRRSSGIQEATFLTNIFSALLYKKT